MLKPVFSVRVSFLTRILLLLIRLYQYTLSPFIGRQCRFTPTCSHYAAESLIKYGSIKGTYLTIHRLSRCHPWRSGGYDPVP